MLFASIFLLLAGVYVSAEGFLNTIYWRTSKQPKLFQAGRILRGLIGVSLIVVGLLH